MRQIIICRTENGWVVVKGSMSSVTNAVDVLPNCHTFNSLDKAIAEIRKQIRAWHQPETKP